MNQKERPFYKAKYQMELVAELIPQEPYLIRQMMRRKGWNLAETIKYYLKKNESI